MLTASCTIAKGVRGAIEEGEKEGCWSSFLDEELADVKDSTQQSGAMGFRLISTSCTIAKGSVNDSAQCGEMEFLCDRKALEDTIAHYCSFVDTNMVDVPEWVAHLMNREGIADQFLRDEHAIMNEHLHMEDGIKKEINGKGEDLSFLWFSSPPKVNHMLVLLVYEEGQAAPPTKARRPLSAREYVMFCPRVPHGGGATTCAICLRALGRGPCRRLRACGHRFHGACLYTWLRRHDDRCPLCRRPAVPP